MCFIDIEMIKQARPETSIVATEPAVAQLLGGQDWSPHMIQGWSPDFIPDVLNREIYDRVLVLGSADVFDAVNEYGFPSSSAEKTFFCGYTNRAGSQRPRPEVSGPAAAEPAASAAAPASAPTVGAPRHNVNPQAGLVAIRQELEARTGREASHGAAYATLERLVKKGLVETWMGEPTVTVTELLT